MDLLKHITAIETSIDALSSKNQVLSEYCTHLSKLKHVDTLISTPYFHFYTIT